MRFGFLRTAALLLGLLVFSANAGSGQTIEWGLKGGINSASINAVPDYYDWLLCCEPGRPDARVDAKAGTGITGGGFVTFPIRRRLAVQGELMVARRRHAVNLEPYEPIDITFTRHYIEAAGLLKFDLPFAGGNGLYVSGGPIVGYRTGQDTERSDPRLVRGNPETEPYVVELLAYATPELLRTAQTSVAVASGIMIRRLVVEVRFTQGLRSIFKDRDGLFDGFVSVGGDPETLERLIPQFAPFLESARPRDLAVLVGIRF
jgi:hypothetical protein